VFEETTTAAEDDERALFLRHTTPRGCVHRLRSGDPIAATPLLSRPSAVRHESSSRTRPGAIVTRPSPRCVDQALPRRTTYRYPAGYVRHPVMKSTMAAARSAGPPRSSSQNHRLNTITFVTQQEHRFDRQRVTRPRDPFRRNHYLKHFVGRSRSVPFTLWHPDSCAGSRDWVRTKAGSMCLFHS
jgi:hypothetical protein